MSNEDFLLETKTAQELYHDHAREMPIFDFHCHLTPQDIAEDRRFENITDIWLRGDHYKWRAMRTNGVSEDRITGGATDREKFQAWAETVPYAIGNPLYHWTHLELRRYFEIRDILDAASAESVWNRANEFLSQDEFRTRGILTRMNVKVVCTTDDPVDSLAHHKAIAADRFSVKVLPAFRPDRAMTVEDVSAFNEYIGRLEAASGIAVDSWNSYRDALAKRIDYFHSMGGRLSDHALTTPVAEPFTDAEIDQSLKELRSGKAISAKAARQFRTAALLFVAREYNRRGWTFQLHIGALRNNNSRYLKKLGPDTGFDSIADEPIAAPLSRFLDMLDSTGELPRTIIYILNPGDNDIIATMIGNFQDGTVPGKVQFGSGWWFNDQKDGMERQMTALASMGLLSRFVGMLTDSRSFMSFPRHEYFRRVLCNLVGGWVERGEAPHDMGILSRMVRDICFNNAVQYFGIEVES